MVDPISGETHCLIPLQAQIQTDPPQTIRRGLGGDTGNGICPETVSSMARKSENSGNSESK